MIKHAVLFRLKESKEKMDHCKKIKSGLLALKDTIPELMEIEVGINENPNEQFDISLITVFNSFDDLKTYNVHPAHVAVAKIIKPVVEQRACADFTI